MRRFVFNWLSERLDLYPAFKIIGENLRKPVERGGHLGVGVVLLLLDPVGVGAAGM